MGGDAIGMAIGMGGDSGDVGSNIVPITCDESTPLPESAAQGAFAPAAGFKRGDSRR